MPPTNAPPQDLLPHEITGPLSYWDIPLPYLMAGSGVFLLLLIVAIWAFIVWRRRMKRRPLTPREKALAALTSARERAPQADSYEFIIEVCDVLRFYLSFEHHLPATTQTSYEFLQTATGSGVFDADRLTWLTRFLDKADAIKFARAEASASDNVELLDLAENLVKGDAAHAVAS